MKLVVCVDDDMGILFNKRRQSQDSVVRDRVVAKLQNANLYMSEYSGKQFELIQDSRIVIGEDFFEKAGPGDYCFLEDFNSLPAVEKIDEILLYRWNRKYPSDTKFELPLDENWKIQKTEDFEGSSHECITEAIYVRKG